VFGFRFDKPGVANATNGDGKSDVRKEIPEALGLHRNIAVRHLAPVAGVFIGARTGSNMITQLKATEGAGTARGFLGLTRRATTAEWRAKWK